MKDQCLVYIVKSSIHSRCMLLLIIKNDFEKINILEYALGEEGGGRLKAYAVYAFINVDNCERPLRPCVDEQIEVLSRVNVWMNKLR